jgi:GcrA cell cycle regulator
MTWTEERVALLQQHWGSGKSASEIARMLGGLTRNAVIGKAHRLGLAGKPVAVERPKPAPVAPAPQPRSGGATILNLTDRMCKWPIGDPKQAGFHFCGRSANPGLPYCQEHAALAYQPASKKREEDRRALGR